MAVVLGVGGARHEQMREIDEGLFPARALGVETATETVAWRFATAAAPEPQVVTVTCAAVIVEVVGLAVAVTT